MFVTDERVVVYQLPDGTIGALEEARFRAFRNGLAEHTQGEINTIWITGKMGIRARKTVQDELMQISAQQGGTNGVAQVALSMGAYTLALLRHNVLRWEGPAFAGVALTQANVDRLDADEPLVNAVIEEIGKRNPLRQAPAPKPEASATPATTAGSSSAGATVDVAG